MKRTVMGLVAAALLATSLVASAQATVREQFHYEDEWSFTEDCGFPVEVTGSGNGRLVVREGTNRDEGVFPVMNRFAYSETWTNQETGEWFVIRGHGVFNEVEATRVEGSIFEFRFVEAGQPVLVEDSSGKVVERNRGSLQGRFLFDTGGDDEPGGDYLTGDIIIRIAGPHPGLDKHPCDYAAELIG
jgi:hypothetical protein